jgi:ADP-ribose pyrophosphatase
MLKTWERVSAELAHSSEVFDLKVERRISPRTGKHISTVVLESSDWVNVVALTSDERVVLIRQYRFGTEEIGLEIPGGLVDPGETPLEAARRELREETGYEAERWTSLGTIAPNPAIHRNRLYTFLAEGCRLAGTQEPDPGEDIEVALQPLREVPRLLASGAISHALVAIAFQKLDLLRAGFELR